MGKETKTVELKLVGGRSKRFVKDEIAAIYERMDLTGGVEVVVQTISGATYEVIGRLSAVKKFIYE